MSTLIEYRVQLGWSKAMLAQEAGVPPQTILQAENGEPISARSARKIAQALSRAFEKVIMAHHIDELRIRKEN